MQQPAALHSKEPTLSMVLIYVAAASHCVSLQKRGTGLPAFSNAEDVLADLSRRLDFRSSD
jgi:hypothetical protein